MFKQLTNIGPTICPTEEVSYITNIIKAGNDEMDTGKITINIDRIGMLVEFGATYMHLSKFIPEVRATSGTPPL